MSADMRNKGEVEPRRSVRATKGQHTKSFDEVEPTAPKRRQTKKSKKAQEQEAEQAPEEPEEIIRCVCGATEQDEDSGEAWISCETCFAWQHNVCVGVSSYEDEIPEFYWCEQCRPENHKELLDGIARGEQPWVERRKAHEEKKRRRGGRKPKAKRVSDTKDDAEKTKEKDADKEKDTKAKPSPAPDAAKDKKEVATTGKGKRKAREDSHDNEGKAAKQRRVSTEPPPQVRPPKYTPPANLEPSISKLPALRTGPARALKKSLLHVLTVMSKENQLTVPDGATVDSMAETSALQIERAVYDTHPMAKGQKEYSQQIKALTFNLKHNPELVRGLLDGLHTPPTLAVMTSDQMASAEQQRQTAEMKAKAEKQSILYTGENSGPRIRRTHKGDEVVEDETAANNIQETVVSGPGGAGGTRRGGGTKDAPAPARPIKNEAGSGDHQVEMPPRAASGSEGSQEPHAGSPSQSNFDISKVFSSVRSPSISQPRRPSAPSAPPAGGPGEDADVDRMLEDENDSPPYSPTTEESPQEPGVIWRGSLAMSTIADFEAKAKYVGGADFGNLGRGPWSKLIPHRMTVAGRITQESATVYLCGLRYSDVTDVIVVSLEPTQPEAKPEFNALIDYFVSKNRYGVVGDKVVGNVRDTYLIPVPAGEDNHPEIMHNLVDNFIPRVRTEPMLLAVFVYRNDPTQVKAARDNSTPPTPVSAAAHAHANPLGTPTPAPIATGSNGVNPRSGSISGPSFSPATPQGGFPSAPHSVTPVPIPQVPFSRPHPPPVQGSPGLPPAPTPPAQQQYFQPPPPQPHAAGAAAPAPAPAPATPVNEMSEEQKRQAQQSGEAIAHEVLGPQLILAPTVQFLLPQAFQMSKREWEVVKGIYEREPRARDDLKYLGTLLEKSSKEQESAASKSAQRP